MMMIPCGYSDINIGEGGIICNFFVLYRGLAIENAQIEKYKL